MNQLNTHSVKMCSLKGVLDTQPPKEARVDRRRVEGFLRATYVFVGLIGGYVKESSARKIWEGGTPDSIPLAPANPPPSVASCFISDSDASAAAAGTLSPPRRTLSSPIKAITLSSWRDNSGMESQKRLYASEFQRDSITLRWLENAIFFFIFR